MNHKLSKITLAVISATALNLSMSTHAQEAKPIAEDDVEIIEVSGIRQSLTNALAEKRSADSLVEIIQSEDIGKLPDQNLAEVLENVTGIQITRQAGVGTGVQIRGTDANRINVSIDGVPLNDSESHGVYWVNMPDFASSLNYIQVQRGVGTSSNGASAFGASINMQTNSLNKEAYGIIDNSFGSFNTIKNSIFILKC
jgi:outer membrane cobalamin receptor